MRLGENRFWEKRDFEKNEILKKSEILRKIRWWENLVILEIWARNKSLGITKSNWWYGKWQIVILKQNFKFIATLTVPLPLEKQVKNKLNVASAPHEFFNHLRIEITMNCVFVLKEIQKNLNTNSKMQKTRWKSS